MGRAKLPCTERWGGWPRSAGSGLGLFSVPARHSRLSHSSEPWAWLWSLFERFCLPSPTSACAGPPPQLGCPLPGTRCPPRPTGVPVATRGCGAPVAAEAFLPPSSSALGCCGTCAVLPDPRFSFTVLRSRTSPALGEEDPSGPGPAGLRRGVRAPGPPVPRGSFTSLRASLHALADGGAGRSLLWWAALLPPVFCPLDSGSPRLGPGVRPAPSGDLCRCVAEPWSSQLPLPPLRALGLQGLPPCLPGTPPEGGPSPYSTRATGGRRH